MNSSSSLGLNSQTIEALISIFSKYPHIEQVIVYGSRAMGNYKTGSDIDITLVANALNTSDLLKIENQLEELMLPYKIDLSLFHQIENPDLIEHVKRVGKVLWASI